MTTENIFNEAKELVTELRQVRSKLNQLHKQYTDLSRKVVKDEINSLTEQIQTVLKDQATVSTRNGVIYIKFLGEYKTEYRSTNDIIRLIHEGIGKKEVFKLMEKKTNSYNEIQVLSLTITNQYLKNEYSIKPWSQLGI